MKNHFFLWLLPGFVLAFSGCDRGELPVPAHEAGDVVMQELEMGADYGTQLWYDLETNTVLSRNAKTDWDLMFEASAEGWHVLLNSAKAMAAAPTGKESLAAVTTADGAAWSWDAPSGHMDSTAIGDWRKSKEAFLIDRGYDAVGEHLGYMKVQFLSVNEDQYRLRFAALDGSSEATFTVPKDSARSFVAFSFDDSGKVLPIEPPHGKWDLLFTQYTHIFEGPIAYLVTGVLHNRQGVTVAVDSTRSFAAITYEHVPEYTFSKAINTIGYSWKVYDFDAGSYNINPSLNYIIHTAEGHYFKLHFVDFYNAQGEKGAPRFEVQRL